jgi:hypothetical protein
LAVNHAQGDTEKGCAHGAKARVFCLYLRTVYAKRIHRTSWKVNSANFALTAF